MRKKRIYRIIAFYMAINLLAEVCCPTVAMALTSGPAQPEMSSFEPVSTSEMVDIFSGDFTYNIPLLDVDGYPVNISYQSNITMDQEASWVGLGWNINPGTITRNMRGIPDDFAGETIKKETNMNPNRTYGVNMGFGAEISGFGKGAKASSSPVNLSANHSFGISYNNYTGISFEQSASIGLAPGKGNDFPLCGSLGFRSGVQGLTIEPRLNYASKLAKSEESNYSFSGSIGTSFNSRSGLKELTLSASISENAKGGKENKHGEEESGGGSLNYSSAISFGRTTYIPQVNMPMKSIAATLNTKFGSMGLAVDIDFTLGGYFSEQKLAQQTSDKSAYGYMSLDAASENSDAILDFNREKDGPFDDHTSTLGIPFLTFDSYNVSGQGIGGIFRPYRNDIGYVYDHSNYSNSDSYSYGMEAAVGYILKAGADFSITDVNSTSGQWNDYNTAKQSLKYRGNNQYPGFEAAYFKQAGEINVDADQSLYNSIGKDDLVRFELIKHSKYEYEVKDNLEYETGGTISLTSANYRNARQNRNQLMSYIKRDDYAAAAADKSFISNLYDYSSGAFQSAKEQIGEITTTKTDGTRYVYGIAAYNTKQREVSFNISDLNAYPNSQANCNTGLVSYAAGTDNSLNNKKGQDNFFSSTEIPAYAHSYLLTAVLSSDYVDMTGDGPTNDDLGTYTKLNYNKTASQANPYHWRVPYESGKANFNEGLKSLQYDDQANYLYGEKEIWFLQSIETKNYIAVFETAPRKDALDAAGENGGQGTNAMQVLKKISLYTKPEYSAATPVPIKEVNFEYDYSLCPGIPNNNLNPATSPYEQNNQTGKLTLKKIYFTYNKSLKGKLSPYEFTYSGTNPTYNLKGYDRWGMYKLNNCSLNLTNTEFPYSEQNKTTADQNASAWSLTKIDLPSGGQINVTYESDDYAYVQDKVAMQMFMISATGSNGPGGPTSGNNSLSPSNNVLFFQLENPIPSSFSPGDAKNIVGRDYFKDLKYLYFRAYMKVNNAAANGGQEYVSGYSEIFDYGVVGSSGPYTQGWVQLKNVCRGDNKDGSNCIQANPISKAAWQFARLHTPREAYNFSNNPDPNNLDAESVLLALADADFIKTSVQTFLGANGALQVLGIGNSLDLTRSWIRLDSPDRTKLGGGSRVKQLSLNDNWSTMFSTGKGLNQKSADYGQVYDYTTKDNESGNSISSGVAQYEPAIGNDENALKLPIAPRLIDKQEKILAPDDFQYSEEPIGESVYPSCSVGYSKVTVKNLPRYISNNPNLGLAVKKHASGKVVYNYYTAKDFPVISQRSSLVPKRGKSVLGGLLKFNVKDFMTVSQGFRVILNDMHGKLKSQFVYAEGQTEAISGMEYNYKSSGGELANSVTVINKNGTISEKNVGIDFDFVGDFRQQETETITAGFQLNLYFWEAGPVPITLPPIIPSFQREKVRFRSATCTKVINKYGILEKTTAYDLGSKVTTEYLAYDATTGQPLLTRTITGFDDNIYNINYPAHFAYSGMDAGSIGAGLVIPDAFGTNGLVTSGGVMKTSSPYYPYIYPGDVYLAYLGGTPYTWYADQVGSSIYLIDQLGNQVTSSTIGSNKVDLKIIRSGHRNMQEMGVGATSSFYNPLDANRDGNPDATLPLPNEKFGIIQSSASEFSDQWKTFCECSITTGSKYNPYMLGIKGNWHKKKDYAFLTTRQQTKVNYNSNTRVDGTFGIYSPFWTPAAGADWNVPSDLNTATPKWTWVNEVTEFSPYGFEVENHDALNRYSAAQFGYNYTLPVGVTSNSKYKQSGFDGFEDYDFRPCKDDHLGFKNPSTMPTNKVDNTQSHTGKRSIKVGAGQSVKSEKVIEICN